MKGFFFNYVSTFIVGRTVIHKQIQPNLMSIKTETTKQKEQQEKIELLEMFETLFLFGNTSVLRHLVNKHWRWW